MAAVASIFLSSHGVDSKFIGRLGDDSDSLLLKKSLKNFKVDYKYSLVLKNTSAHKSFVVQDCRGERLIISYKPSSYDKSKIIFDKKIDFSGIFLADLTWVNASYELCKFVYKNKGRLIIDADLFIKNKKSDYIIKYSSHVIFSKVGVENYTKKKSIKDSLNFLYRKNNKFYAVTDGSKGVTWIDNGIIKKISSIKNDSPAASNGFRVDDIILKIGRESITSKNQYESLISDYEKGDVIMLRMMRDGNQSVYAFTINQ